MLCKVDWISFTLDLGVGQGRQAYAMTGIIADTLRSFWPAGPVTLGLHDAYVPGPGRKPYSQSVTWEEAHIKLFFHPFLSHCLFEISGQGCQILEERASLNGLLEAVSARLTRLDIAVDMNTDSKPREFVAQQQGGRFKSHAEVNSRDGETCYVGSRSSDRFARVYRYNPPHERAHLLRCEYQLKHENAVLAAQGVMAMGCEYVALQLAKTFGWAYDQAQLSLMDVEALAAHRPVRAEGRTDFWLAAQVEPALKRRYQGRPGEFLAWTRRLYKELFDEEFPI